MNATDKTRIHSRMRAIASVAIVASTIAFLAACPKSDEGEDEDALAARTVSVANVERGDLLETVTLVGELQGIEEVRVLAMVTDRIRRLHVKEGEPVRAGQALALLASDFTAPAVEQAEAGLEAARANRDALEREIRRIRPLVEAGSAPRSQLEALETQLRGASAQVRQATAGAGQAAVQQGRTVVRSPIDGVVTGISQQEGEIAAPQMPLLTVVRTDRLKAVLRAPERHFLRIREGMEVRVSSIAGPGHEVRATVSLKGPVVERMTRTGLVEIELDNSDGLLVPGSMVRVVVEIDRKPDVILAPAEAVIFTVDTEHTGRAMIFTVDGEEARRQEVIVGARQDGRIEVREGLEDGETIIIRGAQFLRDGNPIRWGAEAGGSAENPPQGSAPSRPNDSVRSESVGTSTGGVGVKETSENGR